MRQSASRFDVNRLYILGAGASHSATKPIRAVPTKTQAPLDREFPAVINNLNAVRPAWVNESVQRVQHLWKDERQFEEYGLEEGIIRQIGHINFLSAIHPRRRASSGDEAEYLDLLGHLIVHCLRRCKENRNTILGHFASKAFPLRVPANNQTNRVITFNYDDLLDRHLIGRFPISQIYFDKLQEEKGKPSINGRFDDPLLLKLHGSVNWRCEAKEFRNLIERLDKDEKVRNIPEIWFSKRNSPNPGDDVSPCIIPPIPDKPITRIRLFQFLWTRAYEYLHEADEIVVCGYSLPDTDYLARSMFGNFNNQNLNVVTVVDPNPEIMTKWRALFKRRGVRPAEWRYFGDFSEYVNAM